VAGAEHVAAPNPAFHIVLDGLQPFLGVPAAKIIIHTVLLQSFMAQVFDVVYEQATQQFLMASISQKRGIAAMTR
jgi:hypothetical protein